VLNPSEETYGCEEKSCEESGKEKSGKEKSREEKGGKEERLNTKTKKPFNFLKLGRPAQAGLSYL